MTTETEETIIVVNLKAKLRPLDRGDLEDAFIEYCEKKGIKADVIGGGTALEDNGEISECDIEISVEEYNEKIPEQFIKFFNANLAPKGSQLIIEDSEDRDNNQKIAFGEQEGLGLYLNKVDLPEEIYDEYDINYVWEQCDSLVEGIGMIHSYRQSNTETALYMYGNSFDEMKNLIKSFVDSYPLCEKARIVQIV